MIGCGGGGGGGGVCFVVVVVVLLWSFVVVVMVREIRNSLGILFAVLHPRLYVSSAINIRGTR